MVNKFKVGDLVEYRSCWRTGMGNEKSPGSSLGIITDCGLDYPDTGTRRHRYINVHWSDGDNSSIWKGYGNGWEKTKVIVRNEK